VAEAEEAPAARARVYLESILIFGVVVKEGLG